MSSQPETYNLLGHGGMIADRARMDAYARAIKQAVRPGCVVADIGTGTGVFAVLACRSGARRVYAIEPGEIIDVAREIAAANSCADRIEFFQALSLQVTLPERAGVIISDLRGTLPLFGKHIPAIVDARNRFLAPGGTLIPQRDRLWAAVAEAPELYRKIEEPWVSDPYGLNLRACREMLVNSWAKGNLRPEQFLAEPSCCFTLDYSTMESPNLCCEIAWEVSRAGTGHGLLLWFDSTLIEGVEFSAAPDAPETVYGNGFFPWREPIELAAGDHVRVSLCADLVGEDYVWRWDTCVREPGSAQPKVSLKQSTFFAAALSPAQLRKRAAGYVPALDEDGQMDEFILARMDGKASQEEIARRTAERFSSRFARWEDAIARVSRLAQKYCR